MVYLCICTENLSCYCAALLSTCTIINKFKNTRINRAQIVAAVDIDDVFCWRETAASPGPSPAGPAWRPAWRVLPGASCLASCPASGLSVRPGPGAHRCSRQKTDGCAAAGQCSPPAGKINTRQGPADVSLKGDTQRGLMKCDTSAREKRRPPATLLAPPPTRGAVFVSLSAAGSQ